VRLQLQKNGRRHFIGDRLERRHNSGLFRQV